MKNIIILLFVPLLLLTNRPVAVAQEQEIAQLILNLEKLNQLREILDQMYDGYKIITDGYNKVKDITSGNFQLHDLFLDGLYLVNPQVKKYYKVGEIISDQTKLVKEYKRAYKRFRDSGVFTADQINYLATVYSRLFDDSLQNLDELLMVITARQLRMSDDERLSAIDRIHKDMESKLTFLRSFNNQQGAVAVSKLKEMTELQTIKNLHGIQP